MNIARETIGWMRQVAKEKEIDTKWDFRPCGRRCPH